MARNSFYTGSVTNAIAIDTSAEEAAASATAAAASASTAATQASNSATSATSSAASYDSFDDRYLFSSVYVYRLGSDLFKNIILYIRIKFRLNLIIYL